MYVRQKQKGNNVLIQLIAVEVINFLSKKSSCLQKFFHFSHFPLKGKLVFALL